MWCNTLRYHRTNCTDGNRHNGIFLGDLPCTKDHPRRLNCIQSPWKFQINQMYTYFQFYINEYHNPCKPHGEDDTTHKHYCMTTQCFKQGHLLLSLIHKNEYPWLSYTSSIQSSTKNSRNIQVFPNINRTTSKLISTNEHV